MIKLLLATTALIAVSATARAQIQVIDPAAIVKEAATTINTAQTVAGLIHGNGFGGLIPGLSSGIAANPMSGVNPTSLMSGGGGGLTSLLGQFTGQTQPYTPTGNDPQAQMLIQRAQASAGQMAVASQFNSGTTSRLSMLPQLASLLTGTPDVKAAVDANTRVNSEQMTQGAQMQQIQALAIYQQAEANAERSRTELSYRQGADCLVQASQQAASTAASGQVSLVSSETGCTTTSADGGTGMPASLTGADPATGGVALGGGDTGLGTPSGVSLAGDTGAGFVTASGGD